MQTFKIVLSKSYIVRIQATDKNKACEYSEFFTNNIKDISTEEDRINYQFIIEEIDCKFSQITEVITINERNTN